MTVINLNKKYVADLSEGVIDDKPAFIPIEIDTIKGVSSYDRNSGRVIAIENHTIEITGRLDLGKPRSFIFTLTRDDGRLFLWNVRVVSNIFKLSIKLPSQGVFTFSDVEANRELPRKMFTTKTITIESVGS